MKIGVLAADLSHHHGWGHYSASLIDALHRAGTAMTVLTPQGSPIPEELQALPVYPILPRLDPPASGMVARLAALIPQARALLRDCQVIHSHVEHFAPLAAATAGKRRLFITGHGSYVRVDRAYSRAARSFMRWAFRRGILVCVSRYTESVARASLPGVRTAIIPNGVDWRRFAGLPALPKDGRTILTVGAIKPRKGTLTLVRAFAHLRQHIPDARCVIIGSLTADPAYTAAVRDQIEREGLADQVLLMGRLAEEDLRMWYARADVFALPSVSDGWKFEGFGLAALEASAAGLPVIATRGSGLEDAVIDGETGLLVDPEDAAGLAAGLNRLLGDAALRAQMGHAGAMRARAMGWDQAAAQWVTLYQGY